MVAAPFAVSATFDGSLLVSVMNVRFGAGTPKVTGNRTELKPGVATTLAGKMIPLTTETLAVTPETLGIFVAAVIVLEPVATPVTGTFRVVAFAGNVSVEGTVAAAVFVEFKLTTKLVGTGTDKVNVRFCIPPALTFVVPAGKLKVPPTVTVEPAVAT